VQDFVILFCSIRRDGNRRPDGREEVGKYGGFIAQLAVLIIMIILLLGGTRDCERAESFAWAPSP